MVTRNQCIAALMSIFTILVGLIQPSGIAGNKANAIGIESQVNTPVAPSNWQPVERPLGGVSMVYVPAGCFTMGSTDAQISIALEMALTMRSGAVRSWFADEQPPHKVCITEPFWIDKFEVTNLQFAELGGQSGQDSNWASLVHPREMITWFEANAFCAKRGARLPTEAEWEYAARGTEGFVYPWGNVFDPARVVFRENAYWQSASVGSKPAGASWVGAQDMGGNVWEWVSSLYRPYPYVANDGREDPANTKDEHILRGGSWASRDYVVRSAKRDYLYPNELYYMLGFRCALSHASFDLGRVASH